VLVERWEPPGPAAPAAARAAGALPGCFLLGPALWPWPPTPQRPGTAPRRGPFL